MIKRLIFVLYFPLIAIPLMVLFGFLMITYIPIKFILFKCNGSHIEFLSKAVFDNRLINYLTEA